MRGTFDVDPARIECGAATAALRRIFSEWVAIDWFVPPRDPAAELLANQLLDEHSACARAYQPDVFPAIVERRVVQSDWGAFEALCSHVRTQKWDWKYSTLKRLAFLHANICGLDRPDDARHRVSINASAQPGPGDLFFVIDKTRIWQGLRPTFTEGAPWPNEHRDPGDFYLIHATMDLFACLEWQLAEDSHDLEGNPFLPLLRCYASGFYPFSLDQTSFILFAFQPVIVS